MTIPFRGQSADYLRTILWTVTTGGTCLAFGELYFLVFWRLKHARRRKSSTIDVTIQRSSILPEVSINPLHLHRLKLLPLYINPPNPPVLLAQSLAHTPVSSSMSRKQLTAHLVIQHLPSRPVRSPSSRGRELKMTRNTHVMRRRTHTSSSETSPTIMIIIGFSARKPSFDNEPSAKASSYLGAKQVHLGALALTRE